MFFWNSFVFSMIQWRLAIWSLVPLLFSKPSLVIWKFLAYVMLKASMQDFKHDLTNLGDECNYVTEHFLILSFKLAFSLSSFTLIKRFFSFSLLSAIRVVSYVYLRLLMFFPPILIPACNSSSPAVLMMCSAFKLNEQGDRKKPCCTPFSILNQLVVPYRVLTVTSWPVCSFLRKQLRWSGIPISKYFPQFVMIYTVKDFSIVNETEECHLINVEEMMKKAPFCIYYIIILKDKNHQWILKLVNRSFIINSKYLPIILNNLKKSSKLTLE